MTGDERLREALLELEVLRRREAERSRESGAILSALEAMATTSDASAGIKALLTSIEGTLDCDLVALFASHDDGLHMRFPERPTLSNLRWVAPGLVTKKRRIVDLRDVFGLWDTPPEALSEQRALLSVPIIDGDRQMVIVAFSSKRAAFSASDADLLQRLATIASQAIIQRTLEEQSAFLSAVIDASPVSVAIADAEDDMPLIYVNEAFTALTGYVPDEVLGQNCRFMSAETTNSDIRSQIRDTVAARAEGHFVLRNKRKSGEEFWNELRLFPIKDDAGVARQIVATQTDASLRINAEIERDNARRRLEGALSATSEGFLVVGANGTIRFANTVFQDLFGSDIFAAELPLTGEAMAGLLEEPGLAVIPSPLHHLENPVNREVKARNGKQVLLRARPIQGGGVVIAATDVTQTRVNERILRQRLAAIEMSQDGIAIGDPDGRVLHANPSLVALWGLESEAYGLGRKWINFYGPTANARFLSQQADYDATGVWRDEITLSSEGKDRVHDVSLSRVPEVGTVLIVRDITDRQQEEEERNRLRQQLDRASMQDHLGQVSAGLAHDFNNLLSAILGSASLIDMLDNVPEPANDAATRIRSAAEKAAGLVDGFLDLGMRERQTERINLGDAILTTVDLARAGAPSNAHLTTTVIPEPVWVSASQTDLLQVIMNLIVNGLDALEGHQGEVQVSLTQPQVLGVSQSFHVGTVAPGQAYAAIRVQDTGKGMAPQTATKMLEPYFTTKGNQGTGLGLAIVKSKLNANGCLMSLESTEGVGTTFTIYWPVAEATVQTEPLQQHPRFDRRGLPLLVVDDQPDVAAAIAAELTLAGFEVAETSDPVSALETISEDPDAWGCLITDYDMPGLSGGDLVARLAQAAPGLPVIVVSALAKRLTDPRIRSTQAVLSKPVNADRLAAEIKIALQGAEPETKDADITR